MEFQLAPTPEQVEKEQLEANAADPTEKFSANLMIQLEQHLACNLGKGKRHDQARHEDDQRGHREVQPSETGETTVNGSEHCEAVVEDGTGTQSSAILIGKGCSVIWQRFPPATGAVAKWSRFSRIIEEMPADYAAVYFLLRRMAVRGNCLNLTNTRGGFI